MNSLNNTIIKAMEQDPTIACYRDEAANHPGRSLEQLESLGLEKRHLKLLERHGMAVRGRTDDKSGQRVKWIIIIPRTL